MNYIKNKLRRFALIFKREWAFVKMKRAVKAAQAINNDCPDFHDAFEEAKKWFLEYAKYTKLTC